MDGMPVFYPPIEGKADPAITTGMSYLRSLIHQLQVQSRGSTQFLTRKEAQQSYSPAVLRRMFQTGGAFFLNVTDLPGVLAQPQNTKVSTGTATPNLLSPLSQNGTLFVITPSNAIYFFDGSAAPGTWRPVSAAPTSGYTTIQQDGAALTQRSILNILSAGGLIATDDAGGSRTQLVYLSNLLAAGHGDTVAASVVRGDLIFGNSTPKWARLGLGANQNYLRSNATDVSWSALLAADLSGTVPVANGGTASTSLSDGTNIKHKRITTGSIGAGASTAVTLTWTTAFADANYTPQASVLEATTSTSTLRVHHIESYTNAQVVVRIVNDDGVNPHTGQLLCVGIHD